MLQASDLSRMELSRSYLIPSCVSLIVVSSLTATLPEQTNCPLFFFWVLVCDQFTHLSNTAPEIFVQMLMESLCESGSAMMTPRVWTG